MIVATMSLEEKLARVRADVARVLRKYERKVAEMQRAMKVSRNKVPTLHHAHYLSPRANASKELGLVGDNHYPTQP